MFLFDIFFFFVVMALEFHWYRKGKNDNKEFEDFKKLMNEQLAEINNRLQIALDNDVEIQKQSNVKAGR